MKKGTMKKSLLLALVVLTGVGAGMARAADDMRVLLKLERLVDDTVTGSVMLYGNSIDPNAQSIDDRFRLEINGKTVSVPEALLSRLANERRAYSYDALSGGIEFGEVEPMCRMAGPGKGFVLSTLYITYTDYKITASELRPVLTEASNCLFKPKGKPKGTDAELAAAKALAGLQVLLELKGK
jgi:hypothetical protein